MDLKIHQDSKDEEYGNNFEVEIEEIHSNLSVIPLVHKGAVDKMVTNNNEQESDNSLNETDRLYLI